MRGEPFRGFSEEEKARIEYVVSDVDDTITRKGKLYPEALRALWKLKTNGKMVILLTGGSAGWADAYIRQWPVDAVIAEGGALILAHGPDNEIVYKANPMIDPDYRKKKDSLLKMTAGLRLSSDQYARIYDVAYERKALRSYERKTLLGVIQALGGHASESSIHINVSFGNYSKSNSLFYFLGSLFGIEEADLRDKTVYFGDSLNDDEMFGAIPVSVGMHSVEDMRTSFRNLPMYITDGYGGEGFVEATSNLIEH